MSDLPTEPPHAEPPATPSDPPPHYEDPVLLEEDETVPPRPEEDIADQLRQDPRA